MLTAFLSFLGALLLIVALAVGAACLLALVMGRMNRVERLPSCQGCAYEADCESLGSGVCHRGAL